MKSFRELRHEAWKIAVTRWTLRFFVAAVPLAAVTFAASFLLFRFYQEHDIQTWGMFLEAQARMKASGLDFAVASSRQFWSMTWASGFQTFVEYLFQGILVLGVVAFVLTGAVRNDEKGWLSSAFAGFRMPLDAFALMLLMSVRIMLWTLLLIIPGIVAVFRYSMAWYVKAEHPDYTASECLAESGRLTKGHKLDVFLFGLSYLGWLLLAGGALSVAVGLQSGVESFAGMILMLPALALVVFVSAYFAFGNAVFYNELKRISENNAEGSATDVES